MRGHSEETPARTRNKLSSITNDNRSGRKQKPRVNERSDGTPPRTPCALPCFLGKKFPHPLPEELAACPLQVTVPDICLGTCPCRNSIKFTNQPPICLFSPCPYLPPYIHDDSSPLFDRLGQSDQRYGGPNQACSVHFCSTRQVHPDGCVARRLSACIGGSAEHKMEIDALNPASTVNSQHEHQHKARRLRGGGAARVGPVPFRLLPSAPLSAFVLIDAPRMLHGGRQSLPHASPVILSLPPVVDPIFPVFADRNASLVDDRMFRLLRYGLFPSIP